LSAHLQPEIFFNPSVYFVERKIPTNEDTPKDRARGMGPHVNIFFYREVQRMAKKKKAKKKKKVTKKKTTGRYKEWRRKRKQRRKRK
jgi:hypothetical protein